MNRKAVRNSRSEKNEDFFQRKQLFNTKLLQIWFDFHHLAQYYVFVEKY